MIPALTFVGAGYCHIYMSKVTLEKIAKECGVSKGAVSRALADKYNISEETSYRIKQKALELGYSFSKLKVNKNQNRKVLILCPSRLFFKEDFWQSIVKSIADRLSKSSINTEYFIYDENDISASLSNFKKVSYRGFIVIHYNNEELMMELAKHHVPTVVIDPKFECNDVTVIRFSNSNSVNKATRLLIDRGHKRIAFYGCENHSTSFNERYEGFMSALNDKVEHKELLFNNSTKDYADNIKFKKLIQEFKPTAVICANDLIAINAYKVIKTIGLKIPDDISIIGFDNVELSEKVNPKLTTFNIPLKQLGIEAADYLINVIEKRRLDCSEIVVRCEYIERNSVK